MSVPRCVPWASWPEWDSVRVALFGGDPQAQRWALGVVREQRKREANVRHSTSLDFFFFAAATVFSTSTPLFLLLLPPQNKKKTGIRLALPRAPPPRRRRHGRLCGSGDRVSSVWRERERKSLAVFPFLFVDEKLINFNKNIKNTPNQHPAPPRPRTPPASTSP